MGGGAHDQNLDYLELEGQPIWRVRDIDQLQTLFPQASEDISKYLFQMKILLYGDGGKTIHSPISSSCALNDQESKLTSTESSWSRNCTSTRNYSTTSSRSLRKRSFTIISFTHLEIRVRGKVVSFPVSR